MDIYTRMEVDSINRKKTRSLGLCNKTSPSTKQQFQPTCLSHSRTGMLNIQLKEIKIIVLIPCHPPLLCLPVSCKYIYYYKSTNDPVFIQDLEFIFAIMLFPPALNETRHYTRPAVIQGNMVIIISYIHTFSYL